MDKIVNHIYVSSSLDPYENLAVEEYLIETCQDNEIIMYLWQNEKTIVIGKHQNPYKECNLPLMKEDGISLVRRKSGGGAVFHDIGNLNFTFIAHSNNYDEDKHFQVILNALKDWDIVGKHTGRNDLEIDHKKFSGNAFIHHKNISCHHGTILVDAKLESFGKYLTPSKVKIESKGVDSVRSRVVNLKELNKSITISDLKKSLIDKFTKLYVGDFDLIAIPDNEKIQRYTKEYKEWQWNIGESPKAAVSKSQKTSWGNIDVDLSIKNGRIVTCIMNTDTLYDENFSDLAKAFIGKELVGKVIERNISSMIQNELIAKDLIQLFNDFII